jgi:hypothetical protein
MSLRCEKMSQRQKEHLDALDQCLARMAQGETLEACLARYPEQADVLRPLLMTARALADVPPPAPRPEAVARGEARMLAALDAQTSRTASDPAPGWLARRVAGVQAWFAGLGAATRRATLLRLGAGVALLLVVVAALIVLTGGPETATVAGIPVTAAQGRVERLPAGADAWSALDVGDVVAAGDKVRVAAGGEVALASEAAGELVLIDDTRVTLVRVPGTVPAKTSTSTDADAALTAVPVWAAGFGAGLTQVATGWVAPEAKAATAPETEAATAPETEAGLVLVQDYGIVRYTPPVPPAGEGEAAPLVVEIFTPSGVARATGSSFTVTVDADGVAEVAVISGEVAVTTGGTTRILGAGESGAIGLEPPVDPAGTPEPETTPAPEATTVPVRDKERPEPSEPAIADGGDLKESVLPDPSEEIGVRPTVIPEETPEPTAPVVDDNPEDAPPDTPPGLEDKGGIPPGLEDKGGIPPGLEDKGGEPPGQQDKDDKDKGKNK